MPGWVERAAQNFELAADACDGPDVELRRAELQARAAEQHLGSGHLELGIRVLRPLLEGLSIPYPRSAGAALLGTFTRLGQLGFHYWRWRERTDEIDPRQSTRIDTCHTAAKGLVVVDPLRGSYFSALSLILALRSGDAWRTGRALCVVGAAMVPLGGPLGAWAERMLERAAEISRRLNDPYLVGMSSISSAQISSVNARWQETQKLCDQGADLLRDQCRAVTWETDVGSMAAIRALEEQGDIQSVRRRASELFRRGRALGDVYAHVTALLYVGFWRIADSDTDGARSDADSAVELWNRSEFDLQSLYLLRIRAFADIYDGRPLDAMKTVEAAWPDMKRSGMLRHSIVGGDAESLRARAALAAATAESGDREAAVRIASKSAARLESIGRPDLVGAALLVRAGIEALGGQVDNAISRLDAAMQIFETTAMPLHHAYALRRRAQLQHDSVDLRRANTELIERGIDDIERWLSIQAPGFVATD